MLTNKKIFLYNKFVKIKDENFDMKKKELQKLANKIIALEKIIDANEDPQQVKEAKRKIIDLSGRIDPEDMIRIDEIIQEQM